MVSAPAASLAAMIASRNEQSAGAQPLGGGSSVRVTVKVAAAAGRVGPDGPSNATPTSKVTKAALASVIANLLRPACCMRGDGGLNDSTHHARGQSEEGWHQPGGRRGGGRSPRA